MNGDQRRAVITGASAGIGAATARALAAAGFTVHLGARRLDRLEALAAEIGGSAATLDVTSRASVESFVAGCPETVDLLVNNAGKALGRDRLEDSTDDAWREMWEPTSSAWCGSPAPCCRTCDGPRAPT